jgi:hypothetical protein
VAQSGQWTFLPICDFSIRKIVPHVAQGVETITFLGLYRINNSEGFEAVDGTIS